MTITGKQQQVLNFIVSYTGSRGCAPTVQEIADEIGTCKVTAFGHLQSLCKKGALRKAGGNAKTSRRYFPNDRVVVSLELVERMIAAHVPENLRATARAMVANGCGIVETEEAGPDGSANHAAD